MNALILCLPVKNMINFSTVCYLWPINVSLKAMRQKLLPISTLAFKDFLNVLWMVCCPL